MPPQSPVTPVTPSVPGLNLSGGGSTFAASGVSGCATFPSGTDYACSGPWMVETQQLFITYARSPVFAPSATSFSLTKPTCDYRVGYTYMQSIVTANYQVKKVYENYTTSAFTQPQTFSWYPASSDSYDNTYGDVGVSALGPAGNVQTQQQWYNRRPWVSGVDEEVNKTMWGMKGYAKSTPAMGFPVPSISYKGGLEFFGDFSRCRWSIWGNTFLNDEDYYMVGDQDYLLIGQYITTQENPTNIANYIDGLGHDVTNIRYYQPDHDGEAIPGASHRSTGFAEYSVGRHGWV